MKVAVTGHTKGLGRSICECLQSKGIETIGFSRSNGFDISNPKSRTEIIQASKDVTHFFNNAYSDYAQIDLLYEFYESYKDTDKKVINIGSMASNVAEWRMEPSRYSVVKKALDSATYQLINSKDKSKNFDLLVFKPGYLNTSMVDHTKVYAWIDKDEAAKFLVDLVLQDKNFSISEIVMRPTRYNNEI